MPAEPSHDLDADADTAFGARLEAARAHAKLTQKQLSDAVGMSQSTYSELVRTGQGSAKTVHIAVRCGVRPEWLAMNRGEMLAAPPDAVPKNSRDKPLSLRDVNYSAAFTLAPVVPMQDVDMSQKNDLLPITGTDWFTVPGERSNFIKVTQMPDQALMPEIWEGEYIAFDVGENPGQGDTVLVVDKTGRLWVRKFREDTEGRFEAFATDPEFKTFSSDNVQVVGVLVGHFRGRRRRRH